MAYITRKPVPPDYGRRLLPSIIDERARDGHQRPYASIPVSNDIGDGHRDITYRIFANAINRCALRMTELIDISHDFETLVYIGPADLRYQILCMAAVKTGYVMFFVSPRNSMEGYMSLLSEAKATKIIVPSEELPIVKKILSNRPMQRLAISELDHFLKEKQVEAVPFQRRSRSTA